jgi:hypothetical protein
VQHVVHAPAGAEELTHLPYTIHLFTSWAGYRARRAPRVWQRPQMKRVAPLPFMLIWI